MKQFLPYFFLGLFIIGACSPNDKSELQSKVDSLKIELETSQRMAQTLQDVGVLMDSIDANRQLLRINMVEGTTYDNYTSRMKDLNNYVRETEKRISSLEKDLKKSRSNASTFSNAIKKLKSDLEKKSTEIAALQEQVERYRNENQNLVQTISLQEAELTEKSELIQTKEQELALIEARIQELMINAKVTEADAYYARGEAVEEAANRTKLAPKKRKETYKEAIELYKKSLSLGKQEAQRKITELEKKIQ
jgi:chromosome segregation ATPase